MKKLFLLAVLFMLPLCCFAEEITKHDDSTIKVSDVSELYYTAETILSGKAYCQNLIDSYQVKLNRWEYLRQQAIALGVQGLE